MRYSPDKEKMTNPPRKGLENLIEELYNRVGTRFPVEWDTSGDLAVPEVEKEDLPSDVSMSDVEIVLNEMKADGWF